MRADVAERGGEPFGGQAVLPDGLCIAEALPGEIDLIAMCFMWRQHALGDAVTPLHLCVRMTTGATETFRNGTATMVLLLPTWWAVALGAFGLATVVPAALLWAWRLTAGRRG